MFIVIFKTVGYLGWLTTTALGIGGSWFWKFTEDDPDDTDRRKLTPAGRKAIYVMVISVLCAVISTTYMEVDSFRTSQKR